MNKKEVEFSKVGWIQRTSTTNHFIPRAPLQCKTEPKCKTGICLLCSKIKCHSDGRLHDFSQCYVCNYAEDMLIHVY